MKYRPKPHQSPGWSIKGGTNIDIPNGPTKWEQFLLEEKIDEKNLRNNHKVFRFIDKNWDKFYIPTNVLKMYGDNWEV